MVSRAKQNRTLREIIRRVEATKGVVQIDLDLTSLMPIERTRQALRQIGEREGIPELSTPERLSLLPGYTSQAYAAWAASEELASRYPALAGYGSLDGGDYWVDNLLASDEPTPGLADFVGRVETAGGKVVFNSGRWRESMFAPSRAALRKAGLRNIELYIGNSGMSDAGIKESRQAEIREKFGPTVAAIDDRIANRQAIIRGAGGDVMSVGIAIPGFSADPVTADQDYAISTFELDDE